MKLLIIESTKVSFGDDRGAVHTNAAEIVDVSKDVAKTLTVAARALYLDPKDDPNKDRRFTATEREVKAARAVAAAKAGAAKADTKAPAPAPAGDKNPGDPPAA